jgi:hypothetical protein
MTVDEVILKALEGGPATVNDITKRFERLVRIKLEKLRVRGVVVREGRGGAHREFTYRLLRPDRAAKALNEKGGGLSRVAKVTPERRYPADMRAAVIPRGGRVLGAGKVSCSESQTADRANHSSRAKARRIERKDAEKGTSRRAR